MDIWYKDLLSVSPILTFLSLILTTSLFSAFYLSFPLPPYCLNHLYHSLSAPPPLYPSISLSPSSTTSNSDSLSPLKIPPYEPHSLPFYTRALFLFLSLSHTSNLTLSSYRPPSLVPALSIDLYNYKSVSLPHTLSLPIHLSLLVYLFTSLPSRQPTLEDTLLIYLTSFGYSNAFSTEFLNSWHSCRQEVLSHFNCN